MVNWCSLRFPQTIRSRLLSCRSQKLDQDRCWSYQRQQRSNPTGKLESLSKLWHYNLPEIGLHYLSPLFYRILVLWGHFTWRNFLSTSVFAQLKIWWQLARQLFYPALPPTRTSMFLVSWNGLQSMDVNSVYWGLILSSASRRSNNYFYYQKLPSTIS